MTCEMNSEIAWTRLLQYYGDQIPNDKVKNILKRAILSWSKTSIDVDFKTFCEYYHNLEILEETFPLELKLLSKQTETRVINWKNVNEYGLGAKTAENARFRTDSSCQFNDLTAGDDQGCQYEYLFSQNSMSQGYIRGKSILDGLTLLSLNSDIPLTVDQAKRHIELSLLGSTVVDGINRNESGYCTQKS